MLVLFKFSYHTPQFNLSYNNNLGERITFSETIRPSPFPSAWCASRFLFLPDPTPPGHPTMSSFAFGFGGDDIEVDEDDVQITKQGRNREVLGGEEHPAVPPTGHDIKELVSTGNVAELSFEHSSHLMLVVHHSTGELNLRRVGKNLGLSIYDWYTKSPIGRESSFSALI